MDQWQSRIVQTFNIVMTFKYVYLVGTRGWGLTVHGNITLVIMTSNIGHLKWVSRSSLRNQKVVTIRWRGPVDKVRLKDFNIPLRMWIVWIRRTLVATVVFLLGPASFGGVIGPDLGRSTIIGENIRCWIDIVDWCCGQTVTGAENQAGKCVVVAKGQQVSKLQSDR